MSNKPTILILDVDGVFTDGTFYYSSEGKIMKKFGSDDNDALSLLQGKLEIRAVSGDKRGFEITKKRIQEDMGMQLDLVSTTERIQWIEKFYNPLDVIYMGDGIFDALVFDKVGYAIAPANAIQITKDHADYITKAFGGHGAVAEAVLHILEKYFEPFDMLQPSK
ncbi:MAG: HAD hydrolase family protein [Candidatus Andersenbacteria bacterium]